VSLKFWEKTDFSTYTGDNEDEVVIAKLHAHAPEVIRDDDGQWYITSCGWRDFGTVIEGAVAIAKLDWT
jgi:beta-fructofuranosidase